ncbi:MAG: alanine racemase, partial [Candidatus Coatesbacteria bacterium]|nr:alanine racemase [Candidatus Coatesbacteria bacterium]
CGHVGLLRALQLMGVRSMGDSRLENLRAIERVIPELDTWYLRGPSLSSVDETVQLANVSLNSEIEVIEALSEASERAGKIHQIIIMIELGDLREGILPGTLIKFYKQVFELPFIEVLGIGANLGCLAGAIPTVDQFMQLLLYRELLELKFERKLPMISAGSTISLPLVLNAQLPRAINHFRIGEAVFLGTNLIEGGILPGLRDDVMLLEAEITEIKKKGLVPLVETSTVAPFQSDMQEETIQPGQRGYRALVNIGELDTDVSGLTPVNDNHRIAGASSDITVINVGEKSGGLGVGDKIRFKMGYSALLRLMSGEYVEKVMVPSFEEFERSFKNKKGRVLSAVLNSAENLAASKTDG